MTRVVITEFMDEAPLANFPADWTVQYDPQLVDDRAGTLAALADADAIVVRNRTQVNQELLDAAPGLKVVGRLGVGLDNIDMDACAARGVIVKPAVGANALSVAEYVIATAMMLTRTAFLTGAAMISGGWPRGALGKGGEVSGRTMGLIGYGSIARLVAEKAKALGMNVVAHDPMLSSADVPLLALEELLAQADVVSLHVPLVEATRHLINAGALSTMKTGAVLINTARGGVVDEKALVAALNTGDIGAAALDVFETEPLTAEAGKLFEGVPNLVLTPHIAGVTGEGNVRVSAITVQNVLDVIQS